MDIKRFIGFALALIIVIAIIIYLMLQRSLDLESCQNKCKEMNFDSGKCIWKSEKSETDFDIGPCLVENSRHCQREGVCRCYCFNE